MLTGLALAAVLMAPSVGLAQHAHEHVDVLLYDDGSGNIGAGAVDVDALEAEFDHVVFEVEAFGDSTAGTPTFQTDAPGFYSMSDANVGNLGGNDNLPASAAVTVDFLVEPTLNISLAYWDDTLGQFGATPAGESLQISAGASLFGSIGGTTEVLGAAVGSTSGTGFIDEHFDLDLGAATPGVYLAYAQANAAGLNGPSNPFWLVFGTIDECEETASCTPAQESFNVGIEEQLEAGASWVNTTLVPEPGTATLFGLGLMGLARGTRRPRS